MTIPANSQFSFPATTGGFATQDDGSPSTSLGDIVCGPVTNAAIPSKQTQEVAFAGIPAAFASLMVVGSTPIICPQAALPAGLSLSHVRVTAAGVAVVAHGNMTAGALSTGALSYQGAQLPNPKRHKVGGVALGVGQTLAVGGYGTIGTLAAVEGTIAVANQQNNAIVVASPVAALPAGLYMSHARATAGNILVALANPTAGGLTPGNVSFDVVSFVLGALTAAEDGQNGPYSVIPLPGISVTHGLIAALTTLEAPTATLTDAIGNPIFQPGDVVHAAPRAALANVGLTYSHARVSAAGVCQIALANLTGGGLTPGANTYDLVIFRPFTSP